ncbi:DUF3718 domain-containing protein [Shewanella sp. C32]|uniref:DUF3718 domain-containing protein n=1 Tax=Shewanella electrica TaxID=515560 RepID=A0ABT2FM19_9GAMM|nr:DUF3718 domain-containing protein [Shewanella electrica]MCH1924378.1 DUF3718 domain-containing protein [Shewanella electrica]MCS4556279.1 DUF3718 domain-containing protein [Shewanella electrica]
MRLFPVALALVVVSSSILPVSKAVAEDSIAVGICTEVQADNKMRLRKELKDNRLKLRNIYGSVACNGESILRFAYHSNANDTGEFIAQRLLTDQLQAAESDGKSILDWANANGFGDSPITKAIKERLGG